MKYINKMIKENNNGITLIALVVTIIILLILASTSIKLAFEKGLIDIATKGVKNYIKVQKDEINTLEKIETGITLTETNNMPEITVAFHVIEKSANSIVITGKVKDERNQELTVSIEGLGKVENQIITDTKEEKEVTFEIKNLANFTEYQYIVSIDNGNGQKVQDSGIAKTLCGLASRCAGTATKLR